MLYLLTAARGDGEMTETTIRQDRGRQGERADRGGTEPGEPAGGWNGAEPRADSDPRAVEPRRQSLRLHPGLGHRHVTGVERDTVTVAAGRQRHRRELPGEIRPDHPMLGGSSPGAEELPRGSGVEVGAGTQRGDMGRQVGRRSRGKRRERTAA